MGKRPLALTCALGAALLVAACSKSPAPEPVQPSGPAVISTAYGSVSGIVEGGSHAYLGLPFGKPPVGELRWRAPEKPDAWTGVRDGSKFGANCYQAEARRFGPYTPEFMIDSAPGSEDCLYLNVWKPAQGGTGLPVLVFIHGGGFGGGSGSIVIYNGARLAAQGAIVVTVNYRVGAFGFLAHPSLREGEGGTSGNYGLLDMIASLEWVRDNIAAFGGDPANVTAAGQSAGAMAINALLVSPQAQGLFHKVITESGTAGGRVAIPLEEAEQSGSGLGDKLAAHTAAELRALSAAVLLEASGSGPPVPGAPPRPRLVPVIDGRIVVSDPNDPRVVPVVKVPQMSGYNRDEGRGVRLGETSTPDSFKASVTERYGKFAARVLAVYPHATEAEATQSAYLLPRDTTTVTHAMFGQLRAQSSGQPFYPYLFEHVYPGPESAQFGTFHTAEVPYIFGVLDQQGRPFTEEDQRVSRQWQAYVLGFMRTGKPEATDLPPWPASRADSLAIMGLGDQPGERAAASSPEREAVLRDYVNASGFTAFL